MARDEHPTVYSTDGSHLRVCARCGRAPCVCPATGAVVPAQTRLRMRLETKGRGGKAVTVIYDLPPDEAAFATLLKQLKAHCGTGGALKGATLELQGDQRERAQAYLERLGFRVTRSGG